MTYEKAESEMRRADQILSNGIDSMLAGDMDEYKRCSIHATRIRNNVTRNGFTNV